MLDTIRLIPELKTNYKISLICFIVFSKLIIAQPIISDVIPVNSIIPAFEKFEIAINFSTVSYTNPFDPHDIDVKCKYYGPSNQFFVVNGFWDGNNWIVRFSPNEVGVWQYYVLVNDFTGTDSTSVYSFSCIESDHHGFIRISDDDPHYLEYDDDSSFYGIGQCKPWWIYQQTPTIFTDMENSGMNTIVYWLPHWDNMLITNNTGFDHYDMSHATNIDQLLEDCENHNITLVLTIWNHDELRGNGHPWGNAAYDTDNPFRYLVSPVTEFFIQDTSWYYQTWLYRYIVARWSYSRAIQQWQTVTELNGTGNNYFNPNDLSDYRTQWMIQINEWFRSHDPFHHPITSSLSGDLNFDQGFAFVDIPQLHSYQNQYQPILNVPLFADYHQHLWNTFNKPNYIGEFGTSIDNLQLENVHYCFWVSLVTGAALTPMDWNDGNNWDNFTEDIYENINYFSNFISDVEFHKENYILGDISSDGDFYVWGLIGEQTAVVWLVDRTPGESVNSAPIVFHNLSNGLWELYWYNTWTGEYIQTNNISVSGITPVSSPSFSKDIALRMEKSSLSIENDTRPAEFSLTSNYPNPFNNQTIIECYIPAREKAHINVLNIQGRIIRTIKHDWFNPGISRIMWDGCNERGENVGSGIYFIQYKGSINNSTQKISLIK